MRTMVPRRPDFDLPDSVAKHKQRLKAFLKRLGGRSVSKGGAVARKKKDLFDGVSWLGYCTESSLDAATLQDALRWQKQIVAGIARIIDTVATNDWSEERKNRALQGLRRDQTHHSECILNIEAALQRNETVEWR